MWNSIAGSPKFHFPSSSPGKSITGASAELKAKCPEFPCRVGAGPVQHQASAVH